MAKKRRAEGAREQRDREESDAGTTGRVLEELRGRFGTFRQENRPRTRIPEFLRDAALSAVERGTPEEEVVRACRISRELLERWREVKRGYPRRVRPKASKKARVFPVIEDSISGRGSWGSEREAASPLQLQIGGWDIRIRQTGK